jgi:serine/threonine protein kinase
MLESKAKSLSESRNITLSKDRVALKILEKAKFLNSENNVPALINEIRAHWILEQCEGVLKILAIHDNDNYIILVLEYQSKGSLMETLKNQKKFSEVEVRVIME